MSDEKICGRCYLPIRRDDATVYLGDRTSHISARCVALLLAELAARYEQIAALKKDAQIELVFKASRDKLLTVVTAERDAARGDALRYRLLRRKACIIRKPDGFGGSPKGYFDFVNVPSPTYIAPDAATELDAALDAALGGGE